MAPRVEKRVRGIENNPMVEDPTWGVENVAPRVENLAWGVENRACRVENRAQGVQNPALGVETSPWAREIIQY